ncbi:hypothetical protein H5P28_15975 [Ruficoccus amylovorans]|uniref:Uncharacterized protein n=1 Tax=Ruficoccus amylovorans TaxID=1804625 RepID=A0A842HGE8_9BACT|nr:hypothetical protein [Ruficoccus amylovorans]MBC2595765.1 hypothetical protein [Ruficoccus amylovorans]
MHHDRPTSSSLLEPPPREGLKLVLIGLLTFGATLLLILLSLAPAAQP